jgi:hypothetical protein
MARYKEIDRSPVPSPRSDDPARDRQFGDLIARTKPGEEIEVLDVTRPHRQPKP